MYQVECFVVDYSVGQQVDSDDPRRVEQDKVELGKRHRDGQLGLLLRILGVSRGEGRVGDERGRVDDSFAGWEGVGGGREEEVAAVDSGFCSNKPVSTIEAGWSGDSGRGEKDGPVNHASVFGSVKPLPSLRGGAKKCSSEEGGSPGSSRSSVA